MALISCAVLLYEIAITRLLSVVVWYHFAFLTVSLAMLGLGAPGVWLSLRRPQPKAAWKLLVAASLATPLSILVIVRLLAPMGLAATGPDGSSIPPAAWEPILKLPLILATVLVPLILLGAAVCLFLLSAEGRRIAPMYAADLAGATAGAIAVVPLLYLVPTPSLLAACGLLPLAAAIRLRREHRWKLAAIGVLLGTVAAWGTPFGLRHTRNYDENRLGLLYERWTPTARLTVFPNVFWVPQPEMAFGWGMGSAFPGGDAEQLWVEQDGSAGTPITRTTGAPGELDHLFYDVTSLGYQLRLARSVCIIGPGGGRDILTSRLAGAESIDAVELNPQMIHLVSATFGAFSGDPYHLPGVHAFAQEGRSFLTRTEHRYDLLQISLTDSFAATSAGAYALAENYLYTTEAIELYWGRLSDTGMASISRWLVGPNRMEVVRLALLVEQTLERIGVPDPRSHIAIVGGGYIANLLVSRVPFDADDVRRLDEIGEARGFFRLWPISPGLPDDWFVHVALRDGPSRLEALGFYLEPPTDERPFFFQSVRAFGRIPSDIGSFSPNEAAALPPRYLILGTGLIALLLFFTPFALARRLESNPRFWSGSIYFVAIGLGFMFVEVPILQRFVLFLGHPSYAATVVLGSILLGSGAGSLAAGSTGFARAAALRLLLPAAVVSVALLLKPVFGATLGWPLAGRIGVSVAILLPLGFLLGLPFPVGMIRLGDGGRAWFWALNGTAGVLASAAAVTLATYVDLTGVVWIAAGCYVVAGLVLPREVRTV